MENKKILDTNKSGNDNFNRLLNITKQTLDEAFEPFLEVCGVETKEDLLLKLNYDYNSLCAMVMCGILYMLAVAYSKGITQQDSVKSIPCIDDRNDTAYAMNYGRVKRIMEEYAKRNAIHAKYLNSHGFEPRVMAADALWYDLLSEFPLLKRFLHKEEAIITKEFFNELNSVYDRIDGYSGYERFFLFYKLETMSKLEMFYKVLSLIKKKKRAQKLHDSVVQPKVCSMGMLHRVAYNKIGFEIGLNVSERFLVYNTIMDIQPCTTINSIVFNTKLLIDVFIADSKAAYDKLEVLNFINNAVVVHLSDKIEKELSITDCYRGFEFIKEIQQCYAAASFFDDYIDSNNHINRNKDCGQDITFTHFKKIYKLKPERSKNTTD